MDRGGLSYDLLSAAERDVLAGLSVYRLLDTIRHYAADRLTETGGTQAARRRHAAAFLRRAPTLVTRVKSALAGLHT